MNYLLDKRTKRKKFFFITIFISIVIFFILFYFRSSIFNGLSSSSHTVFRPVLVFGNNIGDKFDSVGSYFISKNSLYLENENLKLELNENKTTMANYNSVLAENVILKEMFERDVERSMTLFAILSKPNQSPYDTLIIDGGARQGLQTGDMVFAAGDASIGRIADVYSNSSKVILFSNSGEKTQAVISNNNTFIEVVGRGGGNFEIIMPRDFTLTKGDEVVLPGIVPYILGVVETIISDPRDPFIKALLVSPVNIQELKFVKVKSR